MDLLKLRNPFTCAVLAFLLACSLHASETPTSSEELLIQEVQLPFNQTEVTHRRYYWRGMEVIETPAFRKLKGKNSKPLTAQFFQAQLIPEFGPIGGQELGTLSKKRLAALLDLDETQLSSKGESRLIYLTKDGAVPVIRYFFTSQAQPALWHLDLDSRTGAVLDGFNHVLGFQPATARVFDMDPASLSAQPFTAASAPTLQVPLLGLDMSGHLNGPYVNLCKDLELIDFIRFILFLDPSSRYPNFQPGSSYSDSGFFHFTPDDPRFEETMVYFWVDRAQRYLQSLGIQAKEKSIPAYAHAFSGSNAFYFNFASTGLAKAEQGAQEATAILAFGDGIIDTAEDSSVVAHEYGHAVLDSLAGHRFKNYHGVMFHEGFADFFSYCVRQRAVPEMHPDLHPELLGKWFFSTPDKRGFIRDFYKPEFQFPLLTSRPHDDGNLWSSALYELAQSMGIDEALELTISAIKLTPSSDPADLLQSFLEADQVIHLSKWQDLIQGVFRARGFGVELEEQTADWLTLAPGESLDLVPSEREILVKIPIQFELQSQDLLLEIRAERDVQMLGGVNRVPLEYGYDLLSFDIDRTWRMNSKHGFPRLQKGDTLYLRFLTYGNLKLNLTLVPGEETVPPVQPGQSQLINQAAKEYLSYQMQSVQQEDGIVVNFQLTEDVSVTMIISAIKPFQDQDENNMFKRFSSKPGKQGDFRINLRDMFPNVSQDTAFYINWEMTRFKPSSTRTIQWSFEKVEGIGAERVTGHEPVSGKLLSKLGRRFQLPFRRDQVVRVESNLPIVILNDSLGYPVRSLHYEGKQIVLLDANYSPMIANGPSLFAFPEGDTCQIQLLGELDSDFEIHFIPEPSWSPVLWEKGQTLEVPLQPNTLVLYQLHISEQAQGFHFDFETSGAQPKRVACRIISLGDPNVIRSSSFNFYGEKSRFRKLKKQTPQQGHEFLHGKYWIMLVNFADQAQQTKMTYRDDLDFHQEPVELLDGSEFQFNFDDPRNAIDSFEYQIPLKINPPAGTKRIELQLERLQGANLISLLYKNTTGAYPVSSIAKLVLSERQLGFPPDQGVDLWLLSGLSEYPEGSPRYRVRLKYHFDSALDAEFSHSAALEGYINPYYPFISKLTIPSDTRAVRGSLQFSESYNDRVAWLSIQPGTKAIVDLGSIDHYQLVNAPLDFEISADDPIRGLSQPTWLMEFREYFDIRYLPGFNDTTKEIPFRLDLEFEPFKTALELKNFQALGLPVNSHKVQLVNPHRETLSVQYSGDAGGPNFKSSLQIKPGGFANFDLGQQSDFHFEADRALLVYESLATPQGQAAWFDAPYEGANVKLFGAPIGAARSQLLLANSDDAPAELWENQTALGPVAEGLFNLPSDGRARESLLSLLSALKSPSGLRPSSLLANQLWSSETSLMAEAATEKGSEILYLPTLLPRADFEMQIALVNLNPSAVAVGVTAYTQNGRELTNLPQIQLEAGQSRTLTLDEVLGTLTTAEEVAWLRFHSPQAKLAGQCFIQPKNSLDGAVHQLITRVGQHIYLPGSDDALYRWIHLVNPTAIRIQATLSALDSEGQALRTRKLLLEPRQSLKLALKSLTQGLNRDYIVRIESEEGELLATSFAFHADSGFSAVNAQVADP